MKGASSIYVYYAYHDYPDEYFEDSFYHSQGHGTFVMDSSNLAPELNYASDTSSFHLLY